MDLWLRGVPDLRAVPGPPGETGQRVRGRGGGEQGDDDRHQPGDEPEDEAEVKIMNFPYDNLPPLGRLGGIKVSTGGLTAGELEDKSDEANHQADHQAPEGSRLVGPRPEDGQQIYGADGRSQVARDGLDIIKQLRALAGLNDWNPDDRDRYQEEDKDPPHHQQLHLTGLRPEARVNVHGEDGGGGVEDAGEGGHQSGQHHGQHHPP